MEILEKRFKIAQWIAEDLTGVITSEHRARLEQWRTESASHEREYQEIRAFIVRKEERVNTGFVRVASEWKEFERKHYSRFLLRRNIYKYAAILILPLLLGGYLWFTWQTDPERDLLAENTEIYPGKGKAVLILANGKSVHLGEEHIHVDMEGITVSSQGEKITYQKQEEQVDTTIAREYNTLVIPRGGEFMLELSDGTKVWLNSETKLRFPVHFSGNRRDVEMEGEAYFEVAKNEEAPFHVAVNGIDIEVLGTSFNVETCDDRTVTTLVTGKIELTYRNNNVLMRPNLQAEVMKLSGEIITKEVDARNFTLWKDGVFYFENADLEAIMERLAKWYDVDVVYKDEDVKYLRFSVEMKRYDDIRDLLNKIERTNRVKFLIEGKCVQVVK